MQINTDKVKAKSRFLVIALMVVIFIVILTTTVIAQMMGDINGDGKVDVRDVVLVQKHVLGKITLSAQQKAVANVKGYGEINAQDVTLIMQRSIGRITTFPLNITKVDDVAKTVAIGTSQANIGLPATVSATLSDGAKRTVSVTWETSSTPAYNANVSGSYVFMGNLVNLPSGITNPGAIKAKATVLVAATPGPVTTTGTGSVQVTIEPAAARTAGAQWRLTSGPDTAWKNSGVTLSGLAPGNYTVTYSTVSGWTKPADATVAVTAGATASRTGTYVSDALQLGTLIVKTATSLEVTLTKTPAADLTHANFKVEKAATEGGVFVELTGTASATPGANEFKVTKVNATTYTIGLGTAMVTGNVLKVSPSALVGNELTGPAKEVIVDLTPPVISDQATIRTSATQAIFTFTSTKAGSMYWVVVPDGDTAPTATEVKAGKRSGGANATAAGTYAMTVGSANQVNISSGIQSGVPYQIYYVAADNQAVPNETAVGGPFAISATVAIFIPNGTYELTAVAEGNNKIYRSGNIITIFDSSGVATAYDTAGAESTLISKDQLLALIHISMGVGILNAKGVGNANADTGDKITFHNGLIVKVEVAAPTAARTLAFANNGTLPAAATLTLYGGANGLTVTRTAPHTLSGKITVMNGTVDLSDTEINSTIEAKGAADITVRDHVTYGVVTSQAGISNVKVISFANAGDFITTTGNGATVNWTAANAVTIGGTPTNVTATLTGNDAVTINANVSGTATIPATSGAVTVSAGKTVNKLVVNGAFSGGLAINGTLTNLEVKAAVNTTTLGTAGTITNPIVFTTAGQLTAIDQSAVAVAKTIDFGTTCQKPASIRANTTHEFTLKGTKAHADFDVTITGGKVDASLFSPDTLSLAATVSAITLTLGAKETTVTNSTNAVGITAIAVGKVNIEAGHEATVNGIKINGVGATRTVTAVDANKIRVPGSGNAITIDASTATTNKTVEFVAPIQNGNIIAIGTPNSGTAKLILLAEIQADTGTFTLAGGRVDISDQKSTSGAGTAIVTNTTFISTLFPGERNVIIADSTAYVNVIAQHPTQTVSISDNKNAEINGVGFVVGADGNLIATVEMNNKLSFKKTHATDISSVTITPISSVEWLHFDTAGLCKIVALLTINSGASLKKFTMPENETAIRIRKLVVNGALYEGNVRTAGPSGEIVNIAASGTLGTIADPSLFKIAKRAYSNNSIINLAIGAKIYAWFDTVNIAATPKNGLSTAYVSGQSQIYGTVTTAATKITYKDATNLTIEDQ